MDGLNYLRVPERWFKGDMRCDVKDEVDAPREGEREEFGDKGRHHSGQGKCNCARARKN